MLKLDARLPRLPADSHTLSAASRYRRGPASLLAPAWRSCRRRSANPPALRGRSHAGHKKVG